MDRRIKPPLIKVGELGQTADEYMGEVRDTMLATSTDHLTELRQRIGEIIDLGQVTAVLGWDQETMMPPRGAQFRATQQATVQGILHERLTHPRIGELLGHLAEDVAIGRLSEIEAGIVRAVRRDYDRATKLPVSLVQDLALVTTAGLESWRKAREASRWGDFAPDLRRIVDLKRQEAAYVGFVDTPYDALLDEFEPGATTAQLRILFDELRLQTVSLLGRIDSSSRVLERSAVERPFDVSRQLQFTEFILRQMGFDFEAGRQDLSTHPFTTSFGPTDVRLTTRVDGNDLAVALYASIHEGGHGLYEQGLPLALARSGVGSSVSLGIHESQSRLWENFIGRSEPFWRFALPRLRETFPGQVEDVTPADLVGAVSQVGRSLIRVEADEVTYNLHIIIRFEIERRLIAGDVDVTDLPAVWNDMYREYLGISPPDDRLGVLQDTHWAAGLIGYFPTYTLGNIYGAQLWVTLRRVIPDLDDRIAAGDFGVILSWLREKIHSRGRLDLPGQLIERVTGETPDPGHLVRYLSDKYGALYGV